jgi:hypothetical protein
MSANPPGPARRARSDRSSRVKTTVGDAWERVRLRSGPVSGLNLGPAELRRPRPGFLAHPDRSVPQMRRTRRSPEPRHGAAISSTTGTPKVGVRVTASVTGSPILRSAPSAHRDPPHPRPPRSAPSSHRPTRPEAAPPAPKRRAARRCDIIGSPGERRHSCGRPNSGARTGKEPRSAEPRSQSEWTNGRRNRPVLQG